MDTSVPYYEDLSRISNSNIGWFLNKGPAFLHKMLSGEGEEEKGPQLERGTMIHEYLLQPEEFLKDYVLWDKSRPSSIQEEKFCQALAFSTEIEPNRAILSAFKEAYSTAGKSEDFMLSTGLKKASALKDYIDFLKSNDKRKMISPWDYQMLKKIKYNIEAHKLASKLLYTPGDMYDDESNKTWMCRHEFHINWEYEELIEVSGSPEPPYLVQVHCKSLLDSLTLDFKNKRAIIMDLKTTVKLWHFEDSVDMYDYLRQIAYYKKAVMWYLKYELNLDPSEWKFEYYIIAIDTTGSYEIRVFKFKEFMVQSRNGIIADTLREIFWHQTTGKWEHSRAYYEGDGSESLNL